MNSALKMYAYVSLLLILYLLVPAQSDFHNLNEFTNVHALILARGGSKGIKNKNLQLINGISLLGKTILAIKKANAFQKVWVSTDSKKIAEEAKRYGATVHIRPAEYAQDETPAIDSIKEFLGTHQTIKRIGLFQCTSVFLNEDYIKEAVWRFKRSDCVFATKRSHNLRWIKSDGLIKAINFDIRNRPRRQDWEGELVETGMFYFTSRRLVDDNVLQNERCDVVEIASEDSLEIDSPSDLRLARCFLQQQ